MATALQSIKQSDEYNCALPTPVDALHASHDQLYATGDYFDAAAQYRKAYSQTSPKERTQRGQIALRQAECYRRINYTARAITAYRNALRYKQGDSATRMALGQQLLKVGRYKEAAKVMTEMLDSCPQNGMAQALLASARKAPQWKKEGSRYKVKRDVLTIRRYWLEQNTIVFILLLLATKLLAMISVASLELRMPTSSWLRKTSRDDGRDRK